VSVRHVLRNTQTISDKSRIFSIDTNETISLVLAWKLKRKYALFEEEKALIDNPNLPIHTYNYSAINDRLKKTVSKYQQPTVINRAKSYGYYFRRKKKTMVHDREVLTSAVGDLIQHDASIIHKWSPFANENGL